MYPVEEDADMVSAPTSQSDQSDVDSTNKAKRSKGSGSYLGALALVAIVIPIPFLAALVTTIVYLSPSSAPAPTSLPVLQQLVMFSDWLRFSKLVILLGIAVTLIVWLLLAVICRYFATPEGGRPSDYDGLKREVAVLRGRLNQVRAQVPQKKDPSTELTEEDKAREIAISDINADLDHIDNRLKRSGLTWLSTGYISMWDRTNKADEAMIDLMPREIVIQGAKYDQLRLTGSNVPASDDLFNLLDKAIGTLSSATSGQVSQQSEQDARGDIRKVKSALHKFTNERWDGLIRARNHLLGTAFLTAIFTYILVVIAILANVLPMQMIDAMVFYFLGAIVGLFSRLYDERNTDSVIDDYGLTIARILVTPLLSGLAALVGAFLVPILATGLTTSTTFPGGIATIYDFITHPLYLVYAAVFGFAPNLVINQLKSRSEDIKNEIKSTSAADQQNGKGGAGSPTPAPSPAPEISKIVPEIGAAGTSIDNFTITGKNFQSQPTQPSVKLVKDSQEVAATGITSSDTKINGTIQIPATAQVGDKWDVIVVNPDGTTSGQSGKGLFTIQ